MATMTEDFGHLAGSIAHLRSQRHEATVERRKVNKARPLPVQKMLATLKTKRAAASREQHKEAVATTHARHKQVRAHLAQLGREQSAQAAEARAKATEFMRDLTTSVAAMRDGFAEECRELARVTHVKLSEYHKDRAGAVSAWKGSHAHKTASPVAEPSHRQLVVPDKPAEPMPLGRRRSGPETTPVTDGSAPHGGGS